MQRNAVVAKIAVIGALVAGGHQLALSQDNEVTPPAVQLAFNEKGEAALPRGYRSWVHAFTAWEPITTTILDGTVTATPEFHNLYVEPNTYRNFIETGTWPEGSLMVKEFTFTSTDSQNCSGPPAYVCKTWFGDVIFQHGYTGIGVMLKDSARYPDEPGGWVYFSFGHQEPPYEPFSPVRDRAQCAQCHIDHAGPGQDYVFSINQPGLSREGADAANNLAAAFAD